MKIPPSASCRTRGNSRRALADGKVLAPAKNVEEMARVVTNDYVDAGLTAIFIAVVLAMIVAGVAHHPQGLCGSQHHNPGGGR